MMEDSTIDVTYKCGRAHMRVRLCEFMPAGQTKLKRLLQIIGEDDSTINTEVQVRKIIQYITEAVQKYAEDKETYRANYVRIASDELGEAKRKEQESAAQLDKVRPWKEQAKEEYKCFEKIAKTKHSDRVSLERSLERSMKSNLKGYDRCGRTIEKLQKNLTLIRDTFPFVEAAE